MNHGANDRVIEPARGVDETIARFAATTIRDELSQNNETNIIKMKELRKILCNGVNCDNVEEDKEIALHER